ncbi:MAG TPA: hypothetical protein VIJ35_31430 [Bradyrhizobium sp.]
MENINENPAGAAAPGGADSVSPAQRAIAACRAARAAEAALEERLNRQLLEMIRETRAESEIVNGETEGVIKCPCGVITRFGVWHNRIHVFTRGPQKGSGPCEATAAIARFIGDWHRRP